MPFRLCSAAILALAALLSSACRDSTAPRKTVNVDVILSSSQGPGISSDPEGTQIVTCNLDLTATATGEGSATWVDALFRLYLGKSRTVAIDSATISTAEVATSWGGGTIGAGATQHSTWTASAVIPFAGDLEFHYRTDGGEVKKTKTPFECAPPGTVNAAEPSVTEITVTPSSGELSAGSPLNLTFQATVPGFLWQATVRITGPCLIEQTIPGAFQTTVTQQVTVPLPHSCNLNVPIGVTVSVLDAALQTAQKYVNTSLVLVDKTPPSLVAFFFPPTGGAGRQYLAGDFFAGDSIPVLANAGDNYQVKSVVWDVLPFGVRDSVTYVDGVGPSTVYVHLKPEWTGPIQLKMWAHDAVGLTSDTISTSPDSARVHPTIVRPTRTTSIPGETRDFLVDSKRGALYLRQGNDQRIAVLSMSTLHVTTTVALPDGPMDFDLTLSGDSLLVVLYGRPYLGVIDLRQPTLSMTTLPVAIAASATISGVRVGANGKAYLTLGGPVAAYRTMAELDMATQALRALPQAGSSGNTGAGILATSMDRSVILLNAEEPRCVQRYDVGTDTFSACLSPAVATDWQPAVDGDGGVFALGLDIYDSALHPLPKAAPPIIVGGVPFTAISKAGDILFVPLGQLGVVRLRSTDSAILDRTENTVQPTFIRVSPDGNTLVSVQSNFGPTTKISLIDLR